MGISVAASALDQVRELADLASREQEPLIEEAYSEGEAEEAVRGSTSTMCFVY